MSTHSSTSLLQHIKSCVSSQHRLRTIIILILLGLALGIVIVGFIPISHPTLQKTVMMLIKKAKLPPCTIERITITLWSGVTLEKCGVTITDTSGTTIAIATPKIGITYRIIPLIMHKLVIKKIIVKKPDICISLPDATYKTGRTQLKKRRPLISAGLGPSYTISSISVGEVIVDNGQIIVAQGHREIVRGVDVNVRFNGQVAPKVRGKFALSIDSVIVNKLWCIEHTKGTIVVDNPDIAQISFKAGFYSGGIEVNSTVNLKKQQINESKLTLSGSDLEAIYIASGAKSGRLKGSADLSLMLGPCPVNAKKLVGSGAVSLKKVSAENLPFQNTLALMLMLPKLTSLQFDAITCPFTIEKGTVFTPAIQGTGNVLDFVSSGHVQMSGNLRQQVTATLTAEFVSHLGNIVKNSLLEAEGGKRSFKCLMTGTFENPKMEIDKVIMNRAVNNVLNEISGGLKNLFK